MCGNFRGVSAQPETQLRLLASHSAPPHSFTHAPTVSAKSAFSSLTALRRDVMDHKYPFTSCSGASAKLVLHYSYLIIPRLVFGTAKLLHKLERVQMKVGGRRVERGVGTNWQSDVGMSQKLGTIAKKDWELLV